MIECVMLDTLPEKANLILNILWDRNHPMSVTELIEALKEEFSLNCEKEEVQETTCGSCWLPTMQKRSAKD